MKNEKLLNVIGKIDDDLISGAVSNTKTKKKTAWLKWGAMAACLCLVAVGVMTWKSVNTQPDNSAGTLMGADEIYPSVMVEEQLYEWRRGVAICNELPNNCVYYGELTHVEGQTPTNNCEFVSVFSVSGQIYTLSENSDCVYICLTTEWMDKTVVVFDLAQSSETER